ncbi:hypothetical protein [Paracoccus isoporae]|nr:hypothetical protein [Paracoccus isoporae]
MSAFLTLSPAQAQQFGPPDGCALEMTVQLRGCVVAQHYRCEADAPGDQHVTYYNREGASYHSVIDAETRWLESNDLRTGLSDVLIEESADHASLTTLLRTGRDDFDFWTLSNTGERLRNIGEDRLTGETAVIDGVRLELTEFELRTFSEDGQLLIDSAGQQFVSRDHGRFYGGLKRSEDWTGAVQETNDTPVAFATPGEAGFGSTEPLYDCDMQMVRSGPGPGPARADQIPARLTAPPMNTQAALPQAAQSISFQEVVP